MGADIKNLRTRIKSVNSTLHLTKAMGLVASSKIRRALEGMQKSREYKEALLQVVAQLAGSAECADSPYMTGGTGDKTKIIVIAGDRGLAGGYNANVFRLAKTLEDAEFIPIGKRACDRFDGEFHAVETFGYQDAITLAKKLCDEFAAGEFDKLGIISTSYVSMMSQTAQVEWVLPLAKPTQKGQSSIIFEPDELTVLNVAIYEYVAGMIMASVRESFASEVAARRVAMDSAGKNAQEMLDELGLAYNQARQGAITQEITEIVAGSGI